MRGGSSFCCRLNRLSCLPCFRGDGDPTCQPCYYRSCNDSAFRATLKIDILIQTIGIKTSTRKDEYIDLRKVPRKKTGFLGAQTTQQLKSQTVTFPDTRQQIAFSVGLWHLSGSFCLVRVWKYSDSMTNWFLQVEGQSNLPFLAQRRLQGSSWRSPCPAGTNGLHPFPSRWSWCSLNNIWPRILKSWLRNVVPMLSSSN